MGCAFTQKIVKMSQMLMDLGHEVYVYGAEGGDVECTEYIVTHTLREIAEEWGDGDNRYELGYDWRSGMFRHDINKDRAEVTRKYYENATAEIKKRMKEDDFVFLMQGYYQKPVVDALNLFLTVEPGIGYRGSVKQLQSSKTVYRGFESSYIMNFTYGRENADTRGTPSGAYYDRVFPNYFNKKHFTFKEEKKDYYFYIGRLIHRKGVETAIKVCNHLGKRLIIAGQMDDVEKINMNYPNVEYVGYVDPEKRTELMANARACFVPTIYLEPFGGTNVESQLCGTPVITTDFGAFLDTVENGVTGFRCHTLNDFVQAARNVDKLDPKVIRKRAERYLMDNMKWELEDWMRELYQLYLSAKNAQKVGDKTVYPVPGWSYIER